MKQKLTKEAIEALESMEFSLSGSLFCYQNGDMRRILAGEWIFEEIKPKIPKREKLPKPSIKTVEDFKALKGWEHQWQHNPPSVWFEPKRSLCMTLEEVSKAKIRQIDMPENEYLVADCIEQEIEYVETKLNMDGFDGLKQIAAKAEAKLEAKVREILVQVLEERGL